MTKEEYIKDLTTMVYDVNAAEIASHIENDTLRAWCYRWGSEMINKIMMVNLIREEKNETKK